MVVVVAVHSVLCFIFEIQKIFWVFLLMAHPLSITYHPGGWNKDRCCNAQPSLQVKVENDVLLCIGVKYLAASPFFKTLLELDPDRTGSDTVELPFVLENLQDLPPTKAQELVRAVLFANFDWEVLNSDLVALIYNPESKLRPLLFLVLYFCSEPIREKVYSHVARVVQRTLSTDEEVNPDTVALLELLLDQNRCLSFESPKNVSVLIRQLLKCKPATWKKLAKNLQLSLGPEKAICLLLRTCERLLTEFPSTETPERPCSGPTLSQKRRRLSGLLNGPNPELSSTDDD